MNKDCGCNKKAWCIEAWAMKETLHKIDNLLYYDFYFDTEDEEKSIILSVRNRIEAKILKHRQGLNTHDL